MLGVLKHLMALGVCSLCFGTGAAVCCSKLVRACLAWHRAYETLLHKAQCDLMTFSQQGLHSQPLAQKLGYRLSCMRMHGDRTCYTAFST